MRIAVKVTAKAAVAGVVMLSPTQFKVKVNAPPVTGKANDAVIKLLAEYFGVKKSQVELISGETSRIKVFEIEK